MEDSLFNRQPPITSPAQQNPNNDVLLNALLMQGIGKNIKDDTSPGKINILKRLAPKTRSLKKLVQNLEGDSNELLISGADDAVDILEVVFNILNNKFVLSNNVPNVETLES